MFGIHCTAQLHAVHWLMIAAMTAGLAPGISAAAEPAPRAVLILDHEDPGRYFYGAYVAALRATLHSGSAAAVAVYAENMDHDRFDGPKYQQLLRAYFGEKYQGKNIGVIVTVGVPALEFVLNARAQLWSGVPMFFVAAEGFVSGLKLPPDVTGRTAQLSLGDMVDTARALVPDLEQIALVGDPLERARPSFKQDLPALVAELRLIDLTGLPMAEIRKRVAALPERTVIAYTDIYCRRRGGELRSA